MQAAIMQPADEIRSGRITFTTADFLIQFTENGQFIDLSGEGTEQKGFDENTYNHRRVSVIGHMGDRPIGGDPLSPRVPSFIAKKIVLQTDIAVRAFEIFHSPQSGSALDNWLRAERELLVVATSSLAA